MAKKKNEAGGGGPTKIVRCRCAHQYQDSRYGPGKRVANRKKNGAYTCTVCSSNHS